MLKILVLQPWSYLTDDQTEDQICNRSYRDCPVGHFSETFLFHSTSCWPNAYRPVEVRGPVSPALKANVERTFPSLKSQILFGIHQLTREDS